MDFTMFTQKTTPWKAKCPIYKAIVASFRGKVALKKLEHLAFQVKAKNLTNIFGKLPPP